MIRSRALTQVEQVPVRGLGKRTDWRAHHEHPSHTERKVVTILFTDVRGSMALSRSIELEEWWEVLASLFELTCEGVQRYGGWVASFTGDGAAAVFEAPRVPEAHARRACDAALWLREAFKRPAEHLWREYALELALRIGINTGEVLTGTIGHGHSPCYTATGYTVALAKRIEGLASPGGIYISEHTAGLLGGGPKLRNLGAFEVRGSQEPACLFELVGSSGQDRCGELIDNTPGSVACSAIDSN